MLGAEQGLGIGDYPQGSVASPGREERIDQASTP